MLTKTLFVEQLDRDYWNKRWNRDETNWDLGSVSPSLKMFIDQIKNKDCRILIPGCGNGYEAGYLLNHGFTNITMVDIASVPVENVKALYATYLGNELTVLQQDFFTLEGQYDLIIEQTFFCALPRSKRPAYVQQMKKLLQPSGELAGLLFNIEFDKEGPPFGGSAAEYRALFSPDFTILQMAVTLYSAAPRAGTELFFHLREKN